MCVVGIESTSGTDSLKLTVSGNDVTLLSNDAMVILRGEHTLGDLQLQQNNNLEYVLTSPGYPNNYADNLNCRYTFYAQPGYRVNLTFTSFAVEECIGSCVCDAVTVS